MVYTVSKFIFWLICKIWFRMDASGVENIPKKGSFIVACNHISYLDPAVVGSNVPRKLNFMAKEELFSTTFSSWWMRSVGCVPVKRDSNDFGSLREAMRRLQAGGGLFLFPEGRRQQSSAELPQPQAGIGFLASKLNVPVVPAFVKGTDRAMPKAARSFMPEKVFVRFGEQIHIEKTMPYEEAATLIMKKIRYLAC